MAKIVSIAVVLTALDACTLDEPARSDSVDLEPARVAASEQAQELLGTREPTVTDVEGAALRFVRKLMEQLDQRGYTPEELLAAAEAGDEQRVREMLGYTDAELEAMHAQLAAILAAAEETSADASYPEGWSCMPDIWPCLSQIGPTFLARYASAPWAVILAVGGIQAATCVYKWCSFDRTDPGPPVRRP